VGLMQREVKIRGGNVQVVLGQQHA
jgi:hypothetical protein